MAGYTLLASKGTGSAIVEALLAASGLPYAVEDIPYDGTGPARDRLFAVNPLGQFPTLLLPDGTVMSESAAMVLHIADRAGGAAPVPAPDHPARPVFLRWLVFIVATLYPTFSYGDDPARWVSGEAASADLKRSTDEARQRYWRQIEGQIAPSPWFLGETLSALDVYVSVMTRWRPRRAWFAAECPKLHGIATAMDRHPDFTAVWQRNFG